MRKLSILPLLLAAGCGGGGGEPAQTDASKAEARPPPPAEIAAGRWELTSEVTSFNKADAGPPRINTPVGTRATESVCVGTGEQTPSPLFTGNGYSCRYDTYYSSNGRLSITANCQRAGQHGTVLFSSNGTFTADTLDYTRNLRTVLGVDGDVVINAHVTGRRTGACS